MIRGLASRERQLDIFTEDVTKNIIGVGHNYNRFELDCKKINPRELAENELFGYRIYYTALL